MDILKKRWLTALDETVCPVCGAMNGQTVAIAGSFTTSFNVSSRSVSYMVEHPPTHVNCRCTLISEAVVNIPASGRHPVPVSSAGIHFNRENINRVLRETGLNTNVKQNALERAWEKWKIGYQDIVRQVLYGIEVGKVSRDELLALQAVLTRTIGNVIVPL